MTLQQLRDRVEEQTDNEFDDTAAFLIITNIIIEEINLEHSAKFTLIDETNPNFDQDLETLTGMPSQYNLILIAGISWKLQRKEDEPNWPNYQADYIQLRNRYKHLVPSAYKLENYNDSTFRSCDNRWEIY